MKAAAEATKEVWSAVVHSLVDQMECYFPNPGEKASFSERVQRDTIKHSYHLFSPLTHLPLSVGFVFLFANGGSSRTQSLKSRTYIRRGRLLGKLNSFAL